MKIYTKTGDEGKTSLYGGTKVPKNHIRLEAYGTVDELNSFIGLLGGMLQNSKLKKELNFIQNTLFNVGTELATPQDKQSLENGEKRFKQSIEKDKIDQLEAWIDEMENELAPLSQFILPTGSQEIATAHVARTVCRRAERIIVALDEYEKIRAELLQYINRLSDYFFVLARYIAHIEGKNDITWNPDV